MIEKEVEMGKLTLTNDYLAPEMLCKVGRSWKINPMHVICEEVLPYYIHRHVIKRQLEDWKKAPLSGGSKLGRFKCLKASVNLLKDYYHGNSDEYEKKNIMDYPKYRLPKQKQLLDKHDENDILNQAELNEQEKIFKARKRTFM